MSCHHAMPSLRYAMLCYAALYMLCHSYAMLCYAMLTLLPYYAGAMLYMLCYAMLCYAMLCTPCHAGAWRQRLAPCHAMPCAAMPAPCYAPALCCWLCHAMRHAGAAIHVMPCWRYCHSWRYVTLRHAIPWPLRWRWRYVYWRCATSRHQHAGATLRHNSAMLTLALMLALRWRWRCNYAMPCVGATPHTWRHATPCWRCHAYMPCHATPYMLRLRYAICYAMLCYAMLCYAMLCYAILLCYVMLCYVRDMPCRFAHYADNRITSSSFQT
jgi:hypothetical protein